MMYKIIIVALIMLNPFRISYANTNNENIVILYENIYSEKEDYDSVEVLKKQLLSYSENVDTININSYNENTINKYDCIFIMNIENSMKNSKLIKELSNTNKNIYWIGNGIQNLTDTSNKYSIKYSNKDTLITKVINDKITEYIDDNNMYNIIDVNKKEVKIIASMTNGYDEYPYIIKDQNLYYTVDSDINNIVFLDSLNNYFGRSRSNNIKSDSNEQEENIQKVAKDNEQAIYEQRIKVINNIVIVFIAVIIVVFAIIYLNFRRINKNKFKTGGR